MNTTITRSIALSIFLFTLLPSSVCFAAISRALEGSVIDAISGKKLKDATIFSSCNQNDHTFSNKDGFYAVMLKCQQGEVHEVTAELEGYKPLACDVAFIEILSKRRDMPLLPNGKKLPAPTPSKSTYRNGDNLQVTLPSLYEGCVDYYVGLQYPNGQFFVITKTDKLFDFQEPLPKWEGLNKTAIDNMPITKDMPRGEYTLYLLRTSEGLDNPLEHLDELSVSSFEVK